MSTAANSLPLQSLADLLRRRNEIDGEIAKLIGRPAERSHIGEFIARGVFDISEPDSANQKGHDGVFCSGPLSGRTVNIKFYGADDGGWDIGKYSSADFYLVLIGGAQGVSRGGSRPLNIAKVIIIPEQTLQSSGVNPGCAASVRKEIIDVHMVYPRAGDQAPVSLTPDHVTALELFSAEASLQ